MKKRIKNIAKRTILGIYRLGTRLGVHVIPVHYYSGQPNVVELEKTKSVWAKRSEMPGISIDMSQQAENVKAICAPYKDETLGNKTYHEGVAKRFGPGFGYIEAQALHGVIRHYKPKKIVEVGSGVSTYCMIAALDLNEQETGERTQITCVEPYPSERLQHLERITLIPQKVQTAPLEVFTSLSAGDLLFIDSSHTVKTGGDVNYLFLEVLPRLAPGVIVHIHDINFPYDYLPDVLETFLSQSEVSLLRAYLIFNDKASIVFCMSQLHYDCPEVLAEVFPDYRPRLIADGLWNSGSKAFDVFPEHFPSSIYIQIGATQLVQA